MLAWLFTNTFYGTWLPGDPRGSVTSVRDRRPGDPKITARIEHDRFATPYERPIAGLYRSAASRLKGPPIFITAAQAEVLLAQLIETSKHRGWPLTAVSIMHDHLHWIASIPCELSGERALADYKAYGSRALNRHFGRRPSGTWWTTKGSNRALKDERAIAAATKYVLEKQPNPLVVWSPSI